MFEYRNQNAAAERGQKERGAGAVTERKKGDLALIILDKGRRKSNG